MATPRRKAGTRFKRKKAVEIYPRGKKVKKAGDKFRMLALHVSLVGLPEILGGVDDFSAVGFRLGQACLQ